MMKATTAFPRTAVTRKTTAAQYAALPYRVSGDAVEILLITSLRTRRWIIPKGWPKVGHQPPTCAALEAMEEAGVIGEIGKVAIGQYRYFKQIKNGVSVPCKVDVFTLKVTRERKAWVEKGERKRRWCTVAEAAAAVEEPQLRHIILKFGARSTSAQNL